MNVAPFGMGWTQRIGGPELTEGLSAEESFSRRLFIGILAVNTGMLTAACAAVWLGGSPTVMVASTGGGAALSLLLLVVFAATGRGYVAFVHLFLAITVGLGWVNVVSEGGLATSGQPMWDAFVIVLAAVLLDTRHAAVWFGVHLVLVGIFAWIGPLPAEMDAEQQVLVAAVNQAFFAVGMLLASAWLVEQRTILTGHVKAAKLRSDALLDSVLPGPIADRLRANDTAAQHHEDVGVLFADLAGFTSMASYLPASTVVAMLGELFEAADELAQREGLCKIKTIGDCYMVASNLPERQDDHLGRLLRFAVGLSELVEGRDFDGRKLKLRIGIHVGPVVAGVIGKERLLYDLWGDTVNVASRMESTGEPGRIQVTEAVRWRLGEGWAWTERAVEAKGKGTLTAYLLGDEPEPG